MASRDATYSLKKITDFNPLLEKKNSIQFLSKQDIFKFNLDIHVETLKSYLGEKWEFLQLFHNLFIANQNFDCQVFQTPECQVFFEKELIQPIPDTKLRDLRGLRITAVDGGLGIKEYLGVSLTMVKVGVINYHFRFDSIPSIQKFPPPQRDANYAFFTDVGDFSEDSPRQLANLRRALAENQLLIQFLKTTPQIPDLVILDGSILPPPEISNMHISKAIHDAYNSCIDSYLELYQFCQDQRIFLIGSVKDTKSSVFRDILLRAIPNYLATFPFLQDLYSVNYRDILKQYIDADFLYSLMNAGTRTALFRYDFGLPLQKVFPAQLVDYLKNNPVLASYFQISPYDLPLRIEFLQPWDRDLTMSRFTQIMNLILPLTQTNPQCTLPLPQIEAHLQAHLRDAEMALVAQLFENQFQASHFKSQERDKTLVNPKKSVYPIPFSLRSPVKSWFGTFFKPRHDRLDKLF